MRTTLTLEPDVARLLAEEVHRQRLPLKQVVNEGLRRGLSPRTQTAAATPFTVGVHQAHLMPGLDPAGFNRLADTLEDDSVVARATRKAP